MRTYTITEIAATFNVSRATAYRWMNQYKRQLGTHLRQGKKGLYLFEEGRVILGNLVSENETVLRQDETVTRQSETTQECNKTACDSNETKSPEIQAEYKKLLTRQDETIARQHETITQLQQDIRELVNNQRDERARADAIIFNMSKQIQSHTMLLEDLRQSVQKKVEEKEVSWLRRAWSWMNQPFTFNGMPVDVEIRTEEEKTEAKKSGLRPITEAKAA